MSSPRKITATELVNQRLVNDEFNAKLNAARDHFWDSIATKMFPGFSDIQPPPDPMTEPLPVAAPDTWAGRENRVRWLIVNLTNGEKALLYRLLHDSEEVRLDKCKQTERKERGECSKS
jgi:hypothetical protein